MNPIHHPSEETLLACAAGGLDEAYRVVVATHLAGCATCRASMRLAERLGGGVLDALPVAPMAEDALAQALSRLDDPAPEPLPTPVAAAGLPASLGPYGTPSWRKITKGLALATILPSTGGRAGLHLIRLAPGGQLPDHGHGGLEMVSVLEGAFRDETGEYHRGDLAENSEEGEHAPVVIGSEICVSLIAFSGRLRFRNWIARLMQPFLGF